MTENIAKPLHIYALGNFIIKSDNHALSFQNKYPKKPLMLLKALISFGSFNINMEKLADTLWPDSEGDSALQALHTTLYRLRKLLGDHRFILLQNGKICLNSDLIWVDLWEFHYFYQRTKQVNFTDNTPDGAEKCKHYALQALRYYQGSYLQNESEEYWLLDCREKCQMQYEQLLQFCSPANHVPIPLYSTLLTPSCTKPRMLNINE